MVMPTNSTILPHCRIKKRLLIPGVFIGVFAVLLFWVAVRGTRAEVALRNPNSANDGVLSQLVLSSDGRKEVRCAEIIAAPVERIWNVVTNYNHFAEIFPNTTAFKGEREPDGRWHLTGSVRSPVGRWPVDVHVRHEESPNRRIASWNEPHDSLKVNRGRWTVTRQGENQTLLEYNLDLEVAPFPSFVVRAVLLEQLKPVMKAVAKQAQQKPSS